MRHCIEGTKSFIPLGSSNMTVYNSEVNTSSASVIQHYVQHSGSIVFGDIIT
jgi:hypothetical protein